MPAHIGHIQMHTGTNTGQHTGLRQTHTGRPAKAQSSDLKAIVM